MEERLAKAKFGRVKQRPRDVASIGYPGYNALVIIPLDVPDAIATQMELAGAEGGRRALEILALEGYRSGKLSRGQISELLDLSLWEAESFLKKNRCGLGLSAADYDHDLASARDLLAT
jgi:predicted HTH domain antitoxin